MWSFPGSLSPRLVRSSESLLRLDLEPEHELSVASFSTERSDGFEPERCSYSLGGEGSVLPPVDGSWRSKWDGSSLSFQAGPVESSEVRRKCPTLCEQIRSAEIPVGFSTLRAAVATGDGALLIGKHGELARLQGSRVTPRPTLPGFERREISMAAIAVEATIFAMVADGTQIQLDTSGGPRLIASLGDYNGVDQVTAAVEGGAWAVGTGATGHTLLKLTSGSTVTEAVPGPPGGELVAIASVGAGVILAAERGCPPADTCGPWRVWRHDEDGWESELDGSGGSVQGFAVDPTGLAFLSINAADSWVRSANGSWSPVNVPVVHGRPIPVGNGIFLNPGDNGVVGVFNRGTVCVYSTEKGHDVGNGSAAGGVAFVPTQTPQDWDAVTRFEVQP